MSGRDKILVLQGQLRKTLQTVSMIEVYYHQFRKDFPPSEGGRDYDLVILADILVDYYTCLETAFVRIAKHFENELESTRWHKSLLDRMNLEVPGIRKRLLSDSTYELMGELMRFRHFKHYYVEREYDRERMRLLETVFLQSIPLIRMDFEAFQSFLEELAAKMRT